MRNKIYNDLYFSGLGDLAIENGDLKDTVGEDYLRSDYQELHTIMSSTLGDWGISPSLGANLDSFLGRPLTKSTLQDIELNIKNAIFKDSIFALNDVLVGVIPISDHEIFVRIDLVVAPSLLNSPQDETYKFSFVSDNGTY